MLSRLKKPTTSMAFELWRQAANDLKRTWRSKNALLCILRTVRTTVASSVAHSRYIPSPAGKHKHSTRLSNSAENVSGLYSDWEVLTTAALTVVTNALKELLVSKVEVGQALCDVDVASE